MLKIVLNQLCRRYNSNGSFQKLVNCLDKHIAFSSTCNEQAKRDITDGLLLFNSFISKDEEKILMHDVQKVFRRSKYEYEHWDGAIHGFRESEKSAWSNDCQQIINRICKTCFLENEIMVSSTHILDLAADGSLEDQTCSWPENSCDFNKTWNEQISDEYIRPHTDSVKFCGSKIAGLSLLSSSVARFVHSQDQSIYADILLPRYSLYVMRDKVRYDFTHEILAGENSFWKDKEIPRLGSMELSANDLKHYIQEERWLQPGCILYEGNVLKYSKLYENVTRKISKKSHNVSFMKIKILNNVMNFNMLTSEIKLEELLYTAPTIAILAVPGEHDYEMVTRILQDVRDSNDEHLFGPTTSMRINIVPPNTNLERQLFIEKKISFFPTVQIFWKESLHHASKLIKTLEGPYEVNAVSVRKHTLLHAMRGLVIQLDPLEQYLRNFHYVRQPIIVCVFSSHGYNDVDFLRSFLRASQYKNYDVSRLKFALADISRPGTSTVLSRYLKAHHITSVPFVLVLHQNNNTDTKGSERVVQKVLDSCSLPTHHVLNKFLNEKVFITQTFPVAKTISLYDTQMCSANTTFTCGKGDVESSLLRIPNSKKSKRKKKSQKLKFITDASWDSVFSAVSAVLNVRLFSGVTKRQSKYILVAFVHEDCSFCNTVLSELQQVSSSLIYLDDVSMYLMNCTRSSTVCQQQNVTGYPTIILYGVIPTGAHDACLPHYVFSEATRVAYHGEFESTRILSWLADVTLSAIELKKELPADWKNTNIRLVARLYTKAHVQQYLRRSLKDKLLPVQCFMILCELLSPSVQCYGVPETGVMIDQHASQQLFVSSAAFFRRDGANVTLFRTDYPLEKTLKEESTLLHFSASRKTKHQYKVNFHCEDDHVRCTKFLLDFVIDHLRMPLLHVDAGMFHSHQSGFTDLWQKPILLVLVHQENITESSHFYQQLYGMSLRFYDDVVVMLLDVDRHTHWSHSFVPRHYHTHIYKSDKHPLFQRYPRFCMLRLTDHSHAAFYPALDGKRANIAGMLDIEELSTFVGNYLKGKVEVVETEPF